MSARRRLASSALFAAALAFFSSTSLLAQTPPSSINATERAASSTEALLAEIRRLTAAIEALQTQLAESRRETADVQQSLQSLREQLDGERELLQGQLSSLDQAKVESGSKYRVRLFGMALMQLISTRGAVDNIDLPNLAIESPPGDSGGSISAGVRQSYIGLAVFGPRVGTLTTSGDIRLDFFHGFPAANDGSVLPVSACARCRSRSTARTPRFAPDRKRPSSRLCRHRRWRPRRTRHSRPPETSGRGRRRCLSSGVSLSQTTPRCRCALVCSTA